MKNFMKTTVCIVAALAAGNAGAVPMTLNLVQQESYLTITGAFSGLPFLAEDGVAGTTDYDPASPSNRTTYQGTITVDVNNLMAPTAIKILSSAADADLSGTWYPALQVLEDLNGNGEPGEFGLPPEGDSRTAGSNPGAAADADHGFRVFHSGFGANLAFGAQRDLVWNVTTPAYEAVDGMGQFNSLTENFEYAQGWYDYWVHPAAGNVRGRLDLAGGDNDNLTAALSKYTVTLLPGNQKEYKLFIPVNVDFPDDNAPSNYSGQLVATLIVPEPSTFVLFAMALAAAFAARRRK